MHFNSLTFFVFLVVVYAGYLLASHRWQNRLLLCASYIFYCVWDWRFLGLILLSTAVDFVAGHAIHHSVHQNRRRWFLGISIFTNLLILGFFKYFNFFISSSADLLQWLGINYSWNTLSIVLPVGISFYTFQSMSYTIDIYRRQCAPTERFSVFALFVAYFPQLVAGPIERASKLIPRIESPRKITFDLTTRGLFLILLGLVKKITIADGISPSVDQVFGSTVASAGEIALACYLFAIQIYCDFSGYSDIARGVSKLFGIELVVNFRAPLLSSNPSDFWARWHISLSTWMRDYIYIPLGGNRHGWLTKIRNTLVTFLLSGLWHGAAWSFVLWGLFHGSLVCIWHLLRPVEKTRSMLTKTIIFVFHFHLFAYGWMLFRASSFDQIRYFTAAIFVDANLRSWTTVNIIQPTASAVFAIAVIFAFDLLVVWTGDDKFYRRLPPWVRSGLYAILLVLLDLGFAHVPTEYVYFQF